LQHPEPVVLGYIKQIAINVTRDHLKAEHSQKRGAGETDQWVENAEPPALSTSHGGQCDVEHEIVMQEINRCLEGCTAGPEQERDRMIFWLRHQQGLTAKAIATLPGIGLTESGVESLIARITRDVRERVVEMALRPPESPPNEEGIRPAESY
jgi:DNA-directed RNA polymerase specialized sigma24 family protein